MTPFVHWLIRLRGDEDWDAWGDRWWDHVEKITELSFIYGRYWSEAPEWLLAKPHRKVEWGAYLYEITPSQIASLISRPGPESRERMQRSWQEQQERIKDLDASSRYGIIWIETV